MAELFALHGARVAVASRNQDKVDDTVACLKKAGASAAMGYVCDVRNIAQVADGLAQVHQALNARILRAGRFLADVGNTKINLAASYPSTMQKPVCANKQAFFHR